MERGAIWLVSLVITATVSGQSQDACSRSYLDAAITGFDPFYITALTQPNPGSRSKLFQPIATLTYVYKTVLDSFVNEEHNINYLPEITVQKVGNYKQYLDFTASSAYELSSGTDCFEPVLRYANYSSCETKNSQLDRDMLDFFKDTGGEVLFAKTEIITHTITITPFAITTFTPAFKKAVEALYKAAVNPEIVTSTFNEFVRLYGTHFSRRTRLGSRAIFGKLFSTHAATVVEESARRRCVLEAVREAMRGCNKTTQTVFARASSLCGEEEHEPIVAVTGLLPERNLEDWSSTAKNSPTPFFHELEPLSTLFTTEWFEEYFNQIQVRINGTVLRQYFEENFSGYSRRMAIEGSNSLHSRGCGLNSDCQIGTECRNEPGTESGFSCIPREVAVTAIPETTTPAPTTTTTTMRPTSRTMRPTRRTMRPTRRTMRPTTTPIYDDSFYYYEDTTTPIYDDSFYYYEDTMRPIRPTRRTMRPTTTTMRPTTTTMASCEGRIVIVGGEKAAFTPSTGLYSEGLFGSALPPFPVPVQGNTVSRAGCSVYSCGGEGRRGTKTFKKCWVIDTGTEGAAWRSFDIPWELKYHSAVVVQDEIWFFFDSKLHILDTRNPFNEPREINLGFSFGGHFCAVAHGSKTFVIGAGGGKNEVHVNSDHRKPQQWWRFSTTLQDIRDFGCHVYRGEVFVTAGHTGLTYSHLSSVQAISVVDGTVRSIGPLTDRREGHQMAIIEGRLAVLGGWNGTYVTETIETYDERTNSWKTLGRTLAQPRLYFGLTQLLP